MWILIDQFCRLQIIYVTVVLTRSSLDYDFLLPDHKYEFDIVATDRGSPPLIGSAKVQVIYNLSCLLAIE